MSDIPVFASSITTLADGPMSAVAVTDLSDRCKLSLKVTPSHGQGLSVGFGASALSGEALVCGVRPGEWLVIGDPNSAAAALSGVDGHVVDLTHGRLMIELKGVEAASAMAKVCSLDLSDALMPDGAVTSASVAKVSCDIIRHDVGGVKAYWILADRSFGQYLYDAIVDACQEFNLRD